jgi:hypothetical protein
MAQEFYDLGFKQLSELVSEDKVVSLKDIKNSFGYVVGLVKDYNTYIFKASELAGNIYDAVVTDSNELISALESSEVHTIFVDIEDEELEITGNIDISGYNYITSLFPIRIKNNVIIKGGQIDFFNSIILDGDLTIRSGDTLRVLGVDGNNRTINASREGFVYEKLRSPFESAEPIPAVYWHSSTDPFNAIQRASKTTRGIAYADSTEFDTAEDGTISYKDEFADDNDINNTDGSAILSDISLEGKQLKAKTTKVIANKVANEVAETITFKNGMINKHFTIPASGNIVKISSGETVCELLLSIEEHLFDIFVINNDRESVRKLFYCKIGESELDEEPAFTLKYENGVIGIQSDTFAEKDCVMVKMTRRVTNSTVIEYAPADLPSASVDGEETLIPTIYIPEVTTDNKLGTFIHENGRLKFSEINAGKLDTNVPATKGRSFLKSFNVSKGNMSSPLFYTENGFETIADKCTNGKTLLIIDEDGFKASRYSSEEVPMNLKSGVFTPMEDPERIIRRDSEAVIINSNTAHQDEVYESSVELTEEYSSYTIISKLETSALINIDIDESVGSNGDVVVRLIASSPLSEFVINCEDLDVENFVGELDGNLTLPQGVYKIKKIGSKFIIQ